MPEFNRLPPTLPIFPLEGAAVLPEAELPLNIFEPRYLNMVEDALKANHLIGMVQPRPRTPGEPPPIYRTGCAGRITAYRETDDGRILLTLTGVCRFDMVEELPGIRGYRVVIPEWNRFRADYDQTPPEPVLADRERFFAALQRYFRSRELKVEAGSLTRLPAAALINRLATVLPLEPAEKQAVVEAVGAAERADALLAALELAVTGEQGSSRH
jgi:Lon protease-like protein